MDKQKKGPLAIIGIIMIITSIAHHLQAWDNHPPPKEMTVILAAETVSLPFLDNLVGTTINTDITAAVIHTEPDVLINPPIEAKTTTSEPQVIQQKRIAEQPAVDKPEQLTKPAATNQEEPIAEQPLVPEESVLPASSAPSTITEVHDTDLNDYVQDIIATYSGNYPYILNNDYNNYNGVSENIFYGGALLAKAHPSGNRASHCSGITFEVFFKAMQARNKALGLAAGDFNGMTFNELQDFLLIWFVANGNKRLNNIEVAVERYGIGKRIPRFEEAKRGDFMDISRRSGTGHTVVFQNWVRDNSGNIIGLHYWSSQGSTNGISFKTEYFDTSGQGDVYANQVYIARVLPVHQYKSYK